jgi:hypothetical protein
MLMTGEYRWLDSRPAAREENARASTDRVTSQVGMLMRPPAKLDRAHLNRNSLQRAVGFDRKTIGHSRHEIGYVE